MRWKTIATEIERTATARGRAASGRFSVEGFRLIERAFSAGVEIESVLIGESSVSRADLRARRLLDRLDKANVEIVEAPDIGLSHVIEGRETGAMAALLKLPKSPSLRSVLPARGPARVLAAIDVDDPGNLGALIRTALAGGADAFVVTGPGDPYHPRAVRISRGSLFRIPVVRIGSNDDLLENLAACDVETIAAVTRKGRNITTIKPGARARLAICIGSEAFGLGDGLVKRMDRSVSIPMAKDVDSFSVHAAAAILLYALRKPDGT
ncbi:MAG: RNA methyltransferase [Acidobacteriota bacterium]